MNNLQIILKENLIKEYNKQEFFKKLQPHLISGKYLYHYTLTDNLESILENGLIPKHSPNSFYKNGVKGIFLTNSDSLYNANLPQSLMDVMDDYYDNKSAYDQKPLVRLTIDISRLEPTKFMWDDDYILNKYGWNKAKAKEDKIIESLDIWRAIAYLDKIDKSLIVSKDFKYHA